MALKFKRYFTKKEKQVYEMFNWEKTDVDISDDSGKKSFTQKDVEFPKQWSPLARKIVASKYFYGEQETPERENSAKSLIRRVSETLYDWAIKDNYFSSEKEAKAFSDEIKYLSTDQRMAFNSPVWFNVGTHKIAGDGSDDQKESYIIKNKKFMRIPIGKERAYPQTSACFIQGVEDNMENIMALALKEALLFKYGSGTGTNLSPLRSSYEKISGGGKPSGPLAYWAFYDKVAGIVKSGGKTRRAAKHDGLNDNHPDILEFINSKRKEEEKLHILIDNGIPWREASESVNYQNTNISVRATNEFMQAVEQDKEWQTIPVHNKEMADEMPKYKAKMLMRKIAENTHFCGDPGMQFHDTINKYNTCPNSGKINNSNPCGEYNWMDNSSCNLLSQNIMKYFNNKFFDINAFSSAIKTATIAQDLLIDNSSYPTKEIAKNSHRFRPLGMGYANLGSLFMSLGFAYDSDEARAIAGAITALETGKVYETSTEMAEKIGTFKEYNKNKKPMMKVMDMHKDSLKNIQRDKIPKGLENILDEAEKVWDNVIERGKKYGFRNAQATVLAPTGTIGFMMDCDTKGIEPEIGLVQTKILSDGGTLKLVNSYVKPTLKKLGYEENQVKEMIEYTNKNETIEGAPYIKEEHLSIFDCSNKPTKGTRTISPQGHLKMMAAVQPFLSGAISKTVNFPKEATIEEIEKTYVDAWKMDLKSVAIYRDGSKRVQPLNFSKGLEEIVQKPVRRKLPTTRDGKIHKFDIDRNEGYLKIGLYDDGTPGELFITMSKEGSTIQGLMNAFGTSVSLNLQYGVPLEKLVKKFRHQKFEPKGIVWEGHSEIHTADSIIDYIFHCLEKEYVKNGEENKDDIKKIGMEKLISNSGLKINKEEKNKEELNIDLGEPGGFCQICGSQMYKKGSCSEVCSNKECVFENQNGCGA